MYTHPQNSYNTNVTASFGACFSHLTTCTNALVNRQYFYLSLQPGRLTQSPAQNRRFMELCGRRGGRAQGGLELGKPERGRGFPVLVRGEEVRASLVPFSSADQRAPFFSPPGPPLSPPSLRSGSLTQGLTCSLGRGSLLALVLLGLAASSWPGCAGKAGASTPRLGVRQGG